jgi:hypothetical protein
MQGFFSTSRPGEFVPVGETRVELPILYFRTDCFMLVFTADAGRVRNLMPSDKLHPVRLSADRALVAVAAFNYIDTTIGSYGEVAVAVPVVHRPNPPPVILPLLFESTHPGFGMLVVHLPVTNTLARDCGRTLWGYTKFVADMRFTITPEYLQCTLSENQDRILKTRVMRRGIARRDVRPLVTFSVRHGQLIKAAIQQTAICRFSLRPKDSFLELGTHPMSEDLRDLQLSPNPIVSRYYLERSAILPAGEVIEQDVRPLEGYLGEDREGMYSVDYTEL